MKTMFRLFLPNIHFVIVAIIVSVLKLTFPSIPAVYIYIAWVIGYGSGMFSMYRRMVITSVSRWVSIKESFPEKRQIGNTNSFITPVVLIKVETDGEDGKIIQIGIGAYSHFHNKWLLKDEPVIGDVIEWMYLP